MRAVAVVIACGACTTSKPVVYVGPFVQLHEIGAGNFDTFTGTASASNDAIVMLVGCEVGATTPTDVNIDASAGWGFVRLSPIACQGALCAASFAAYSPGGDFGLAVTIDVLWSDSCMRRIVIADEFRGVGTFAAHAEASGACATTIGADTHDAVWAACYSNGGVVAPGIGFSKGADDNFGDWTEYALAPAPAQVTFDVSGATSAIVTVLALRPR